MPERLDRVVVKTNTDTIVLSWSSRDALLDRIRQRDPTDPMIDAFEAAGATRPVELSPEQCGQLHVLIDEWSREVGKLPEGIWALRSTLAYE